MSVAINGNVATFTGTGQLTQTFVRANIGSATEAVIEDYTSIGEDAFYNSYSLTSVIIGNSVLTIGQYAFFRCRALTSVTIGNSVNEIVKKTFAKCTSLTSVTIGNSVTTIRDSAFYDCTALTSVTIGNSVTTIGYMAFNNCAALTSIIIPDSVSRIGQYGFENTALIIVYATANNQLGLVTSSSNSFYGKHNVDIIIVDPKVLTYIPVEDDVTITQSTIEVTFPADRSLTFFGIKINDIITSVTPVTSVDNNNKTTVTGSFTMPADTTTFTAMYKNVIEQYISGTIKQL
jgi:hypothetical protein